MVCRPVETRGAQLSLPGWATLLFLPFSQEDDSRVVARVALRITRRARRQIDDLLGKSLGVPVTEETLDCHYCGLSSVEILAAPSSITRCLSANLSAASLFENVATTRPFVSPTLTSNLDPSLVTTYVLMAASAFTGRPGYNPVSGIKLVQHPLGLHDPSVRF